MRFQNYHATTLSFFKIMFIQPI